MLAGVAQLAEHRTFNADDVGSNPAACTIIIFLADSSNGRASDLHSEG